MAKFRPLEADDYQYVREHIIPQLSGGEHRFTSTQLREILERPGYFPCVLEKDEGIIAYGELHVLVHPSRGFTGRLERIIVDVEYRANGYGQELCEGLLAVAAENGCAYVDLITDNNKACCLYEKLGFEMQKVDTYRLDLRD